MPFEFSYKSGDTTVTVEIPDQAKQLLDHANRLRDPHLTRYLTDLKELADTVRQHIAFTSVSGLNDVRMERLKDHVAEVVKSFFGNSAKRANAHISNINESIDRAYKISQTEVSDEKRDDARHKIDVIKDQFRNTREMYKNALKTIEGKWNTGTNKDDPEAWLEAIEKTLGFEPSYFHEWVYESSERFGFTDVDSNQVSRTLSNMIEYCYYEE